MQWKTKARIQNAVSLLPSSLSYTVYYWIQRNFGGLNNLDPREKLKAGIETCKKIQDFGRTQEGMTFLEIGTGRVPLVPMAYWLMGAKKVVTIDLNPYVKEVLLKESLEYIKLNKNEIKKIFGNLLFKNRLEELLAFYGRSGFSVDGFLEFCQIEYIAPGDAAETHLLESSIDFHTSYQVLEHIPQEVISKIFLEGNRIVKDDGMFVHRIDYSDHFSHSDNTISSINFLQYCASDWSKYAGNRYMYMNRLRHDDFLNLYSSVGQDIISCINDTDDAVEAILSSASLSLNEEFSSKPVEILSIVESWIMSEKKAKPQL